MSNCHPVDGLSEPEKEIEYPASDGERHGGDRPSCPGDPAAVPGAAGRPAETDFVAADMFWYWEEGHPESCVAPDVMVVKGVGRSDRRSFFTWREGGAIPCVVFEMASENTWREDLGKKRRSTSGGRPGILSCSTRKGSTSGPA